MPVYDVETRAPDPSAAWDYARAELAAMVVADEDPRLPDETLNVLLERAAVRDAAGRLPAAPDWTPTFDLDRAAANGWRLKAGRVAGDFNILIDGHKFDRAQRYAQFMEQAREYDARAVSAVGM